MSEAATSRPNQQESGAMRRSTIQAVIVAIVTSMLVSCSTIPKAKTPLVVQIQGPSAEFLLKEMARAYASLKSYADSGVVYDYREHVRDEASIAFRIHFVRPDHLRFEMTDNVGSSHFPEDYRVLWSYGNATYSWWQSNPQIQTSRDVTTAIAGFTGISRRSVHNIPSLLQTNFGWQEFLNMISSPKVLGEETFEEIDCFRIQGEGRGERRFEIWIGKSDYLIRRVRTTYPNFCSDEIHRGIAINQPISPDMLSFAPPVSVENHKRD
jgi:hypothetical protein